MLRMPPCSKNNFQLAHAQTGSRASRDLRACAVKLPSKKMAEIRMFANAFFGKMKFAFQTI